jgi:hypothetical protein
MMNSTTNLFFERVRDCNKHIVKQNGKYKKGTNLIKYLSLKSYLIYECISGPIITSMVRKRQKSVAKVINRP